MGAALSRRADDPLPDGSGVSQINRSPAHRPSRVAPRPDRLASISGSPRERVGVRAALRMGQPRGTARPIPTAEALTPTLSRGRGGRRPFGPDPGMNASLRPVDGRIDHGRRPARPLMAPVLAPAFRDSRPVADHRLPQGDKRPGEQQVRPGLGRQQRRRPEAIAGWSRASRRSASIPPAPPP